MRKEDVVVVRASMSSMSMSDNKCWQCDEKFEKQHMFCPACKVIQGTFQTDHFTRLNLPRKFDMGEKNLEVAYFALQRVLHPDMFINKTDKEKKFSAGHSVDLNDAYMVLKSPLKRAEYLLKLNAIIVNHDSLDSVRPSAELLEESLELRERLDHLSNKEQLRELAVGVNEKYLVCIDSIKDNLENGSLMAAAQDTIRLRYIDKLIEEIKQKKINN